MLKIRSIIFALFILMFVIPHVSYAKTQGKFSFAVDNTGGIYFLVPTDMKKIHHYSEMNILTNKFADEGPNDGELLVPIDMVMWKDKLYVLDLFGPQIKMFSLSGKYIGAFGKDLPKDQRMKSPSIMRIHYEQIDEQSYVYVLDKDKKQVTIFTLDGKFVKGINLPTSHENYFEWITSFDLDSDGNIWFVSDSSDDESFRHVLVFNRDGVLVKDISLSKIEGRGYMTDIVVLPEGRFILVDSSQDVVSGIYTGALIFFDEKGDVSERKELYESKSSRYYSPYRVKLAVNGMYVMTRDSFLLKLDSSHKVMKIWALN